MRNKKPTILDKLVLTFLVIWAILLIAPNSFANDDSYLTYDNPLLRGSFFVEKPKKLNKIEEVFLYYKNLDISTSYKYSGPGYNGSVRLKFDHKDKSLVVKFRHRF